LTSLHLRKEAAFLDQSQTTNSGEIYTNFDS